MDTGSVDMEPTCIGGSAYQLLFTCQSTKSGEAKTLNFIIPSNRAGPSMRLTEIVASGAAVVGGHFCLHTHLHCFPFQNLDWKWKRRAERKRKCGGEGSAERWKVGGAKAAPTSRQGNIWQAAFRPQAGLG